MKNAIDKITWCAAALLIAVPLSTWGQASTKQQSPPPQQSQSQTQQGQTQQSQQQQGQQGPTGQGSQTPPIPSAQPAQPAVDPAEEAAFKQFRDLNTPDAKLLATSGEDFLKKYPNSHYTGAVYSRLTSAYMQLGDTDHMFAAGNKALELIPEDVDVLPVMAMATSRRIDPGAVDADQKERMAKTYADSGILELNKLQRPTDSTADQWDRARDIKLSMCHSALGLVDYDQSKYTEAIQEFTEAIKLEHDPDPVDQYLLGVSFTATKDFTNAIANLEACTKQEGSMRDTCQRSLDNAKKKAAAQPPKQ